MSNLFFIGKSDTRMTPTTFQAKKRIEIDLRFGSKEVNGTIYIKFLLTDDKKQVVLFVNNTEVCRKFLPSPPSPSLPDEKVKEEVKVEPSLPSEGDAIGGNKK